MSSGGIRQSAVFIPEAEYGVTPDTEVWYAMPPGGYFSSSRSRNVTPAYEVGRKHPSMFIYGKTSGTWTWNFVLDYDFLEPLFLAFDTCTTEIQKQDGFDTGVRIHTLEKTEEGVPRSFSVRRKRVHRTAGGTRDEITQLTGCICTSIRIGQSAGSSSIPVAMSGIYADESMLTDGLAIDRLDTVAHTNNPVQWGCIYDGDKAWGQVQSWRVQVQNTITGLYGVENSRLRSVYEDRAKFQFAVTVHSHNPDLIQRRTYSGGRDNTQRAPLEGGAGPMPRITLRADDGGDRAMAVEMDDCVFSQAQWDSGESGRLLDILDGARCRNVRMIIQNRYTGPYGMIPYSRYSQVPAEYRPHIVRSPSD